jgi:hypothetical protein
MKKNLLYISLAALSLTFAACENGDNEFPNFDYSTVKFANQYPVRTIELGEDENVDLTGDNQHTITIKAVWGGGYSNPGDVLIDYMVDPSLCTNLYFAQSGTAGEKVEVMPQSYYELKDSKIRIPAGQVIGGVDVKLTDAFFADPKSVSTTYVIPIRMTQVAGADSILTGKAIVDNPSWTTATDWSTQPMNYVLYAVKFVNPWHGQYLRRGIDQYANGGSNTVRHQQYVENDEAVNLATTGMQTCTLPLTLKDASGNNITYTLQLTFAADGSCTLSSNNPDVVVSGKGTFVSKGEKQSLGGKDRDALYLDYNVNLKNQNLQFATKDTLVLRTRNVMGAEYYSVIKR